MQKQQQTCGSGSDDEKAIGVMDPNYVDWVLSSLHLRLLRQHTRGPCHALLTNVVPQSAGLTKVESASNS